MGFRHRAKAVLALVLGLVSIAACQALRREPELCRAAQPPANLAPAVPEWRLEPNMLMWESTPNDQPHPATYLTFELRVANAGRRSARDVRVWLGSDLFGWQEMKFDYGKAPTNSSCPNLDQGQRNTWIWGHSWKSGMDPAWRRSMEQSARLRLVWRDDSGWHELVGRPPGLYAPSAFGADEIK